MDSTAKQKNLKLFKYFAYLALNFTNVEMLKLLKVTQEVFSQNISTFHIKRSMSNVRKVLKKIRISKKLKIQ